QTVVDHFEIARFEDVERHLSARQEQRARQRKHRDRRGQIGRAAIDRVHRHRASTLPEGGQSEAGPPYRHGGTARCAPLPALHAHANRSDDSRLRPATVASSVGPQASNSCTSCLRAPSSFHLRSRRTISISWSSASLRLPLEFKASARSKRAWWSSGLAATFCSSSASGPTAAACSASSIAEATAATALSMQLASG